MIGITRATSWGSRAIQYSARLSSMAFCAIRVPMRISVADVSTSCVASASERIVT